VSANSRAGTKFNVNSLVQAMNLTAAFDPCRGENSTETSGEATSSPNVFVAGVIVAILGSTGEQLGLTLWKLAENRARDRASPRDGTSIPPLNNDRLELQRRIRRSIMGGSVGGGLTVLKEEEKSLPETQNNLGNHNSYRHETGRQNSIAGSSSSMIEKMDAGQTSMVKEATQVPFWDKPFLATNSDNDLVDDTQDLVGTPQLHEPFQPVDGLIKPPSRQAVQDVDISVRAHSSSEASSNLSLNIVSTSHEASDQPSEPSAAEIAERPPKQNGFASDLGGHESASLSLPENPHASRTTGTAQGLVDLSEAQQAHGPKARRPGRKGCLDREGLLGLAAFVIFVLGNGLNFVALGLIQVRVHGHDSENAPGPVPP
jgi:hypothetical protein